MPHVVFTVEAAAVTGIYHVTTHKVWCYSFRLPELVDGNISAVPDELSLRPLGRSCHQLLLNIIAPLPSKRGCRGGNLYL